VVRPILGRTCTKGYTCPGNYGAALNRAATLRQALVGAVGAERGLRRNALRRIHLSARTWRLPPRRMQSSPGPKRSRGSGAQSSYARKAVVGGATRMTCDNCNIFAALMHFCDQPIPAAIDQVNVNIYILDQNQEACAR